ncbi:MAG: type II toxin-antitoxin system Phd/YefM family antitoxin [Acidobacteriota bacterium]
MNWKVAEAKQKLSQLLRATSREPQLIYNRDRLVAVVVKAETFAQFEVWEKSRHESSVGEAFDKLRRLCAAENYTLEPLPRHDRANAFEEALDQVSL